MFVRIIYCGFVSAVVSDASAVVSAVFLRCLCGASAVLFCFFVSAVLFLFLRCFCGSIFGTSCRSEFVSAVPLRRNLFLR